MTGQSLLSLSHCLCVFLDSLLGSRWALGAEKKTRTDRKRHWDRSREIVLLATHTHMLNDHWPTIEVKRKKESIHHCFIFFSARNKIQHCMLWCGKANCPYGIHIHSLTHTHSFIQLYNGNIFSVFYGNRIDTNRQTKKGKGRRELGASEPHICTVCFMCAWMSDCLLSFWEWAPGCHFLILSVAVSTSSSTLLCSGLQIGTHTHRQADI